MWWCNHDWYEVKTGDVSQAIRDKVIAMGVDKEEAFKYFLAVKRILALDYDLPSVGLESNSICKKCKAIRDDYDKKLWAVNNITSEDIERTLKEKEKEKLERKEAREKQIKYWEDEYKKALEKKLNESK